MAIEDRPPFILTHAEKSTGLWSRLTDHFTTRLADLRGQNDGALDPIQTAMLRGQIAFAKEILRLGEELPPVDSD